MQDFHKVRIGNRLITPIDWEMNPSLSFGTFESWGGRERVRNNNERIYYFFIDNWGEEPKLCLMERGVKHAKVLAEICAPPELVKKCVEKQGKAAIFEKSYSIDEEVKSWLIENVLGDNGKPELVLPIIENESAEDMGAPLPLETEAHCDDTVVLPATAKIINDDEIAELIKKWNFFDTEHNSGGQFDNCLVQPEAEETIVDLRTGLMWQRGGLDIHSIRTIQRQIEEIRVKGFAGFFDWRLPTMEEAMSLLEPQRNEKGLYLHPCFYKQQAFIFVDAQRKPGGYWFVDFKQGRAFWSSGTIPGGFGRLVRNNQG